MTVDAAVVAEVDAATSDAGAVDAATVADAPREVTPQEAMLRAVVDGTTPITDLIDPARGVSRIAFVEAPPSGQGRENISARRLCGAAVGRAAGSLRDDLRAALAQAHDLEEIHCDARMCVVPGMEYAPVWRVYFAPGADGGAPRIEAISQVSEATMGEAWMRRVEAHVDRALAAQHGAPCPGVRR